MCEHFAVPSIRSREIAWAEWPYVWRFEHLLELLDIFDNTFYVHVS
jgi:hypothetical protein